MTKKRRLAGFFSVLLPLLGAAAVLMKPAIVQFTASGFYPDCMWRRTMGLLCPGCGNTRAVLAILHGDLLTSLRYNPSILILCIVLLGFYGELVSTACGRHVKIVPRSYVLLYGVLGLLAVYWILRNIFPWMTLAT